MGRLILGKSLQPLNHDYLPNLANVWASVQDPWYDKGSQYTVPYATWTTGIGYRADKVSTTPDKLSNPYEIYWDERKGEGVPPRRQPRRARRTCCSRTGSRTSTPRTRSTSSSRRTSSSRCTTVNVKTSTDDYTNLPEGKAWVHQMWSGSAISAQWYLPDGVGTRGARFWFPEDGRGIIGSDMIAIPSNAKNPVLAHHFLNYLLDEKHGYDNFVELHGYQPPFTASNPDRLVADGVVAKNLRTAIVRESDFDAALPFTGAHAGGRDRVAERLGRVQGGCLSLQRR